MIDAMAEPDEKDAGQAPEGGQSEEEIRAQLEEEIRKVRIEDVILQSAVSILNLSARRIAKEDERDLEQARAGIDAAGALAEFVPAEAQGQLRQAVSELKMLYAKHAGEGGAAGEEDGGDDPPAGPSGEGKDSGLWTPGGSS
jgi:hypothetical protein